MMFYIDLLYIFMIIDLFDVLSFNCLFIFLKWIIDIDLSISCQQQENNDGPMVSITMIDLKRGEEFVQLIYIVL